MSPDIEWCLVGCIDKRRYKSSTVDDLVRVKVLHAIINLCHLELIHKWILTPINEVEIGGQTMTMSAVEVALFVRPETLFGIRHR